VHVVCTYFIKIGDRCFDFSWMQFWNSANEKQFIYSEKNNLTVPLAQLYWENGFKLNISKSDSETF
jgi:hypothetical protein